MHPESMTAMRNMLQRYGGEKANVLDVGSLDINGTYRDLVTVEYGFKYTGLDQSEGPNVDIVSPDPFNYPIKDNTYDIVISGSTMEHVTAIWKWVPELVRVLKPGGLLCIVTHWSFPEHRYPVDCWRILPDGMQYLFDETGMLEKYDIRIATSQDINASAFKVSK